MPTSRRCCCLTPHGEGSVSPDENEKEMKEDSANLRQAFDIELVSLSKELGLSLSETEQKFAGKAVAARMFMMRVYDRLKRENKLGGLTRRLR